MKKNHIFISFLLLLAIPMCVYASSSANIAWEGNELFEITEEFTQNLIFRNIQGSELISAGGIISVSDETCFDVVKVEIQNPFATYYEKSKKFAYSNLMGTKEDFTMLKVTLKAKENTCSANLKLENPKLSFADSTPLSPNNLEKEINIVNYDELKLNASDLKLSVGETYQLEMYVPNGLIISPNKVTFTSKNNTIVSIDKGGKIKANQTGETNVTASYGMKTLQTKVTVLDYLKGDINGDGKINPLDHYLALRMSLGLNKPNSVELIRGDINNNNRIDAGDVYYILRRSLGLKSE